MFDPGILLGLVVPKVPSFVAQVGAINLSTPTLLLNPFVILCSVPKASAKAFQAGSWILPVNHTNRLQRIYHNEAITKPITRHLDGSPRYSIDGAQLGRFPFQSAGDHSSVTG
jgi:hypothetical protein